MLALVGLLLFSILISLHFHDLSKNIGKNTEDVWIGGLPTIVPGDDNQNPIKTRIGENGMVEYYRKRV